MAAIVLLAPEVYAVLRYHFPVWDDIAIPLTVTVHVVGFYVQKYTAIYRVDL